MDEKDGASEGMVDIAGGRLEVGSNVANKSRGFHKTYLDLRYD